MDSTKAYLIAVLLYMLHECCSQDMINYCLAGGATSRIAENSGVIHTLYEGDTTYKNNQKCFWVIDAGPGENRAVQLTITQSHLEWAPANSICQGYDYIEVRNGNSDSSDSIVSWCGEKNPYSISSTGRYLFIEFSSNGRNIYTYKGAIIEFESFQTSSTLGGCPPGWYDSEELSGGGESCYTLKSHEETWTSAQRYCNYDQSNLAMASTEEDLTAINDILQAELGNTSKADIWIGLNDIENDGSYKWLGGLSLQTSLARWRDNPHTSDPYLNCIKTKAMDGLWAEDFCNENDIQTLVKYRFVCQKNKVGTVKLHVVPNQRTDKSGKSSPKVPIIAWLIPVLFVVLITAGVIVYCVCKHQREEGTKRDQPVGGGTAIPLQQAPRQVPPYSERGDAERRHSPPPAYDSIVSATV